MSFAIFLDVDGVLNTRRTVIGSPNGRIGVDENRIKILAKAIEKYGGGEIILTSDWKKARIGGDLDYLKEKLEKYGLTISGATKDRMRNRGQGIVDYLSEHPEIDEYVILDDNKFDFEKFPEIWERLILTDGIQQATFASESPAVETLIFYDYLKEVVG